MRFSDKLNFLMNITRTTNSALALHISLDASYISRLRRGKRMKPRDREMIRRMADYFARNLKESYQEKAVSEAVQMLLPTGRMRGRAEVLEEWLNMPPEPPSAPWFAGDGLPGDAAGDAPHMPTSANKEMFFGEEQAILYGVEGKREGAILLLQEVLKAEKPLQILLFSDEETSWMTEKTFAGQWVDLMQQVLAGGHRVTVIHTVSRQFDEMLSAISQWMPLYISGLIEPFFYPKKRDGVFQRTIFVAQGKAALISGSVDGNSEGNVNLLFRGAQLADAYEREFRRYLALCRPLMRVYRSDDRESFRIDLADFEKAKANVLMRTESLSFLTMPEDLLATIAQREDVSIPGIKEFYAARRESFLELLKTNTFCELIALPGREELANGRVPLALVDALRGATAAYRPEEYKVHLAEIIRLMDGYERYHVMILPHTENNRYAVYIKEERGVIIYRVAQPPVMLGISEGNLTAAFWDHHRTLLRNQPEQTKSEARQALVGYLAQME